MGNNTESGFGGGLCTSIGDSFRVCLKAYAANNQNSAIYSETSSNAQNAVGNLLFLAVSQRK